MVKSFKDYLILSLINEEEIHGYRLLKDINEQFELKKITLYKTLENFEKKELITVSKVEKRRKYYKITKRGKSLLTENKHLYQSYAKAKPVNKIGYDIKHFETIDSTNNYLKKNYRELPEGYVVTADNQTNGKGRLGRTWIDESGKNVLMSILLKPNTSLENISKITQLSAASVFNTLKDINIESSIKWPNDVLVDGKKICGILVETVVSNSVVECVVLGIGLNVNMDIYEDEIRNKATSIKTVLRKSVDIEYIRDILLKELNNFYVDFLNGNDHYIDICRENSYIIGKTVKMNIGKNLLEARIIDITFDGRLVVDINGTIEFLNFGEVSLENIY